MQLGVRGRPASRCRLQQTLSGWRRNPTIDALEPRTGNAFPGASPKSSHSRSGSCSTSRRRLTATSSTSRSASRTSIPRTRRRGGVRSGETRRDAIHGERRRPRASSRAGRKALSGDRIGGRSRLRTDRHERRRRGPSPRDPRGRRSGRRGRHSDADVAEPDLSDQTRRRGPRRTSDGRDGRLRARRRPRRRGDRPDTAAVVVTSPSNPTGKLMPETAIDRIATAAAEHGRTSSPTKSIANSPTARRHGPPRA